MQFTYRRLAVPVEGPWRPKGRIGQFTYCRPAVPVEGPWRPEGRIVQFTYRRPAVPVEGPWRPKGRIGQFTYCRLPVGDEINGEVLPGEKLPRRVELEFDEPHAIRTQALVVHRQSDSVPLK